MQLVSVRFALMKPS